MWTLGKSVRRQLQMKSNLTHATCERCIAISGEVSERGAFSPICPQASPARRSQWIGNMVQVCPDYVTGQTPHKNLRVDSSVVVSRLNRRLGDSATRPNMRCIRASSKRNREVRADFPKKRESSGFLTRRFDGSTPSPLTTLNKIMGVIEWVSLLKRSVGRVVAAGDGYRPSAIREAD